MILEKLCRETIPSKYLKLYYTSIATLRSLITKKAFKESINSFLNSNNAKDAGKYTAVFQTVTGSYKRSYMQIARSASNSDKGTISPSVNQVIYNV